MPCFILRIKNNQMKIPVKRKNKLYKSYSQMNAIFVRATCTVYESQKYISALLQEDFLAGHQKFI